MLVHDLLADQFALVLQTDDGALLLGKEVVACIAVRQCILVPEMWEWNHSPAAAVQRDLLGPFVFDGRRGAGPQGNEDEGCNEMSDH